MPQPDLINWDDKVDMKNVGNAKAFLSLVFAPKQMGEACEALLDADVIQRRANDILRATGSETLPSDDPGVQIMLKRVLAGKKLKPALLVQHHSGVYLVNGHHKVCLAYMLDPFQLVNCAVATIGGDDETSN